MYELNEREQRALDTVNAVSQQYGLCAVNFQDAEPKWDKSGGIVPVDHIILPGRRWLVDGDGTVWKYLPEGSAKDPAGTGGGGAPRRNNAVEMWNGKWRKVELPDGTASYAKCILNFCVDKRVSGAPGISNIQRALTVKGYKHPHAKPDAPSAIQIKVIDRKKAVMHDMVLAKLEKEGVDPDAVMAEPAKPVAKKAVKKAAKKPTRTNKRAS
jgi:hypothetical protein